MDDLVIEIIQQRGLDLHYVPREGTAEKDFLFGEDPENSFSEGVVIEMMCDHLQGFEGEGDFMAGFGLDIRDEASFTVARTRFIAEISKDHPEIIRPQEGDLIVFPTAKAVFEITFVEHENPFYQIGKGHTWDMSCKRFEWSHEDFAEPDEILNEIPTFPDNDDSSDIQDESDTIVNFDEQDPFSENDY